ncbi:MAG TPA: hypothetical protein VFD21_04080 [Vicinamibacterales bacterium]|jgi:hypothetical protein|nr:hypothetical protein [Vicinamibacterales bacterium]
MLHRLNMLFSTRRAILLMVCVLAASQAYAADEAMLFRIFLTDGSSLVTYGEYARTSDQVVLSLPIGGTPQAPRLHAVTLAASKVDWEKTERFAASARYQRYVATRAEADYQQVTEEVATVLSNIAQSTDRASALAAADRARRTLAEWPRMHYGYRQQDIQEIVRLLDSAIARLQGGPPPTPFQIALVNAPEMTLEPVAAMPSPREQLDQLLRLARITKDVSERFTLLQSALTLIAAPGVTGSDASKMRRLIEDQLDQEIAVNQRYGRVTKELLAKATKAAGDAEIRDVEHVLDRIPKEDAKLGHQRPEIVQALTASVQLQLANARRLRLLRDQWKSRQAMFREYQRSVGMELVQLVKARSSLESIKRLEGPDLDRLDTLNRVLRGGAVRLDRLLVPEYLRDTHEMVIGAWRFAENAAAARLSAVTSGDISKAWEASSAAAGALMMLSRAQKEMRTLIEPPKLQ